MGNRLANGNKRCKNVNYLLANIFFLHIKHNMNSPIKFPKRIKFRGSFFREGETMQSTTSCLMCIKKNHRLLVFTSESRLKRWVSSTQQSRSSALLRQLASRVQKKRAKYRGFLFYKIIICLAKSLPCVRAFILKVFHRNEVCVGGRIIPIQHWLFASWTQGKK